jgi:TonB family protein
MPTDKMGISFERTKLDSPPRLLRGESPTYPIMQRRYGGGGYAVIGFVIDESGRTRDFTVVKTNYKYFAGAAIIAMKGWRFEPAKLKGKPVAVHARAPFTFTTDRRLLRRRS